MCKGNKSIRQVKDEEISTIGTAGETFKHIKKYKHLSVARYYFLEKGVDLGFPLEFTKIFKKELIGAYKDVKAATDATSERFTAQPQRKCPAVMETHPGREFIGRTKDKDLVNLLFQREEAPNEAQSGENVIIHGVSASAADKETKDIHQSASNTTIPQHDSESTARDRLGDSYARVIATILDKGLIRDAINTSSGLKISATTASGNIAFDPPTNMPTFHEQYNSVFMTEASAMAKVKEVEDERSAIKAKREDLKNQDISLAQKEVTLVEEKNVAHQTLKRVRSELSHEELERKRNKENHQ